MKNLRLAALLVVFFLVGVVGGYSLHSWSVQNSRDGRVTTLMANAMAELERGSLEDATAFLNQAVGGDDSSYLARLTLGEIYEKKGLSALAAINYQRAFELLPADSKSKGLGASIERRLSRTREKQQHDQQNPKGQ